MSRSDAEMAEEVVRPPVVPNSHCGDNTASSILPEVPATTQPRQHAFCCASEALRNLTRAYRPRVQWRSLPLTRRTHCYILQHPPEDQQPHRARLMQDAKQVRCACPPTACTQALQLGPAAELKVHSSVS